MSGVDFRYWNELPEDQVQNFLVTDYANPSRAILAAEVLHFIVGETQTVSVAEIGPGTGYDFFHNYAAGVLAGRLTYTGYEGSPRLAEEFQRRLTGPRGAGWCTGARVVCGSFGGLEPHDVVISRHVLEHQPTLQPYLDQQLHAARRLCSVCWFRAPGDTEQIVWNEKEGLHYNTYVESDIVKAFGEAGFTTETLRGAWQGQWGLEPYVIHVGRR